MEVTVSVSNKVGARVFSYSQTQDYYCFCICKQTLSVRGRLQNIYISFSYRFENQIPGFFPNLFLIFFHFLYQTQGLMHIQSRHVQAAAFPAFLMYICHGGIC